MRVLSTLYFGPLLVAAIILCLTAGIASVNAQGGSSVLRQAVDPDYDPTRAQEPAKSQADPGEMPEQLPIQPPAASEDEPAFEDVSAHLSRLLFVVLEGRSGYSSQDRSILQDYPPGGVILQSALSPTSTADYITAVRKVAERGTPRVPLFVGGDLFTLPRRGETLEYMFPQLPSLLAVAAAGDQVSVEAYGSLVASQMELLGFNLHAGPSLSLSPSLSGARGSLQCLGSDPEFAGMAGAAIVESLVEKKIVPMVLGFPGGSLNKRSDELAVLLSPLQTLSETDLLPYRRAVDAGAPMINVHNTLVPALSLSEGPASLSPRVIQGMLREDLGFEGVVVSGPLNEPELEQVARPSQAAVRALQAGADMLLFYASEEDIRASLDAVRRALDAGELSKEQVRASLKRIQATKKRFGLHERPLPNAQKADQVRKKQEFSEEAYKIERRSITLLKNNGGMLPLSNASRPILVTSVVGGEELRDALVEDIKPVSLQPIVSARHLTSIEDFEIRRITRSASRLKTAICVFTPWEDSRSQQHVIRELQQKNTAVVVVLLGYPHSLPELSGADAIIAAYPDKSMVKETMRAVASVLTGKAPVRILDSVRDFETVAGKEETYNAYEVVQAPAGRLPVEIEPPFVAGRAVSYSAGNLLKKVQWRFSEGKPVTGVSVNQAFPEPGRYPVTITLTTEQGETVSATFHAQVAESARAAMAGEGD